MSFADSTAFMQDSIFEQGGSDATWLAGGVGEGIACKVLTHQPDQAVAFGDQRTIVATVMLKVRKKEIVSPAADDTVTIGSDSFQIIGTPTLDKYRNVWTCEAVEL